MNPENQRPDSPNVLAPPPLIFAAGFALGLALQWLFPFHPFQAWPCKLAGWAIAVLSGILALWGAWTMHRAGTHIDPRQPTSTIVTHGPFRFTRNPLYLSLSLLSAGAALFFNLPWNLLTLLPTLCVINRFVVRREERYLQSKFGDAYRHYQQKTRRWL